MSEVLRERIIRVRVCVRERQEDVSSVDRQGSRCKRSRYIRVRYSR